MQLGRVSLTAACFSLVLVGVSVRTGHAQSIQQGKITGTVVSEDKLSLPGATVEISSPALITGSRSVTTSTKGSYVFPTFRRGGTSSVRRATASRPSPGTTSTSTPGPSSRWT